MVYVNYDKFDFCVSCEIKYPKDERNNCIECGRPLRKKRRGLFDPVEKVDITELLKLYHKLEERVKNLEENKNVS